MTKVLSPFAAAEIHHCIAFMRTLLQPIKSRNEFLTNRRDDNLPIDPINEGLWTIIDSEGEDDHSPIEEGNESMVVSLKERDLVALLNQIPLQSLFEAITFVESNKDESMLYENAITGHHILKCIAFASEFVQILGDGLLTYESNRYKFDIFLKMFK